MIRESADIKFDLKARRAEKKKKAICNMPSFMGLLV
jgi:hypothetical protein